MIDSIYNLDNPFIAPNKAHKPNAKYNKNNIIFDIEGESFDSVLGIEGGLTLLSFNVIINAIINIANNTKATIVFVVIIRSIY
jgi:hypothetical protein